MAKVRKNIVISGLSGSLGDQFVIQTGKGDQTIIRTKPRPSDQLPSAAQAEARQRFQEATAYAQRPPPIPASTQVLSKPSRRPPRLPKAYSAGGHPYLSTCFNKPGRTLGFADPKGFRQILDKQRFYAWQDPYTDIISWKLLGSRRHDKIN